MAFPLICGLGCKPLKKVILTKNTIVTLDTNPAKFILFLEKNDPTYFTTNYQNIIRITEQKTRILKYSCMFLLRYQPALGVHIPAPSLVLCGWYLRRGTEEHFRMSFFIQLEL